MHSVATKCKGVNQAILVLENIALYSNIVGNSAAGCNESGGGKAWGTCALDGEQAQVH